MDDASPSIVKPDDGFFATFFVSSFSPRIVARLAARGTRPNRVTGLSVVIGIAAALSYAAGGPALRIVGSLLLYVAFVLDCVDGQLARSTGQFSSTGAALDAVSDRLIEIAIYAGLAYGLSKEDFGANAWVLAAGALVLLVTKHLVLEVWNLRSLIEPASASGAANRRMTGVAYWIRRSIAFPIGERIAVIALATAVAGPRVTLTVLVGWGFVALAWVSTGRMVRTWA